MARRKQSTEVNFSNLDKVFFPATKFTKGDLIRYYIEIAPMLLPHFRRRPVTLIRMPNGVRGERFYEKNAPGHTPDWVPTTRVPKTEGGEINYITIDDARTLAWCANNGAVELHPFLHRADDIRRPTHIAFDLDPGEGADLLTCIEVGEWVREVLATLHLEAFPKVTGSKGLQLYVPLNTAVTYDTVTPFAEAIAELLEREHPDLVVSDMSKALRVNKVFIDWSQNHEKKTTVGAYSVRGKRDAPFISMPVSWAELRRAAKAGKVDALFFSPADALKRVKKLGDLFAPVLKKKQKLPKAFVAAAPRLQSRRSARAPAALRRYAEKRDFGRTAEPAPAVPTRSRQGSRRRFVIQKHAASHLHYDFRLEMDDVLKSWAVPKGLSTEVGVKRSAFQTEDHPLEYFTFEGTIPAGQYGGGTVMVWDVGTYDIIGGNYWKGDLKLWLSGKKLKGEWHIFRIKSENPDKPVWLIAKAGESAKPVSARDEDRSVVTRRTMAQIAKDRDAEWQSNRPSDDGPAPAAMSASESTRRARKSRRPTKASEATREQSAGPAKPRSRPRRPTPEFVAPMLARAVAELPEGDEWLYEIKLDGYRALGLKHGDTTRVLSRKDKTLSADFPGVTAALKTLAAETVLLDGEIVALDETGRPAFQLLQNRRSHAGAIVFYAFDLLSLEGKDWRDRPLAERKEKLAEIVAGSDVKFSASFNGPPNRLVDEVRKLGLEGVIAKRRDSTYRSGERSGAWVKFKLSPEQEFVIGGFKPGAPVESLVVGTYENGRLLCAGKVRQGLNPRIRRELYARLEPLLADVCPFSNLPNSQKSHWGEGITAAQMKELCWVMPRLVAQVSFTEWTSGGNLRHGTFKGLREDKDPIEVVRES
jgi:bifunctional non-homologous end joining protein LigD